MVRCWAVKPKVLPVAKRNSPCQPQLSEYTARLAYDYESQYEINNEVGYLDSDKGSLIVCSEVPIGVATSRDIAPTVHHQADFHFLACLCGSEMYMIFSNKNNQ
jgi:hypothetical protein